MKCNFISALAATLALTITILVMKILFGTREYYSSVRNNLVSFPSENSRMFFSVATEKIGGDNHGIKFSFILAANLRENCTVTHRILIPMILYNAESFGVNAAKQTRRFADVLDMYRSIDYPKACLSLSFLVSDLDTFNGIISHLQDQFLSLGYSRATVIFHESRADTGRRQRHDESIQKSRRKMLSRSRNFLISHSLIDEYALFWIDADVIAIPPQTLKVITANPDKEIVNLRCSYEEDPNYDLNAWAGDKFDTQEQKYVHRINMKDFMESKDEFVKLDSVGATNLYIKADLIRWGLEFPPLYIVGTSWRKEEGDEGVESEGVCYMAKAMGSQCWGMPHLSVEHSPDGR